MAYREGYSRRSIRKIRKKENKNGEKLRKLLRENLFHIINNLKWSSYNFLKILKSGVCSRTPKTIFLNLLWKIYLQNQPSKPRDYKFLSCVDSFSRNRGLCPQTPKIGILCDFLNLFIFLREFLILKRFCMASMRLSPPDP